MTQGEERPTFMRPEELDQIVEHCKTSGAKDVLEIGTYCGAATRALLRGCSGTVFSCDPMIHPSVQKHHQEKWIRYLTKEFPDRFVFFPCFSHELIWSREISILMVDGDHRPSSVIKDLRLFCPFIEEGGTVILDDANQQEVSGMWEYYRTINKTHSWKSLRDGKLQIWRKHKS